MEIAESKTTAEVCGNLFARAGFGGSTHVGTDPDSICRYMSDADTPWGAPGVNTNGLHIEQAGYASQTRAQWTDDASLRTMENSAVQAAEWCVKYGIPVRWLTDYQIRAKNIKGFLTHADATRAFGTSGGHSDPGPNFPRDYFLTRVNFHVARIKGSASVTPAPAPKPTSTKLAVDGSLGPLTIKAWQRVMGTTQDGVISTPDSSLIRAVQKRLGLKQDGSAGPITRKAVQKHLGVAQDGNWGPLTIKALQTRLNTGKF